MVDGKKGCDDCFYSRQAVNEDFMYCSYVGDVLSMGGVENGYNMDLARELSKTIGFSGDVYEAFIDMGGKAPVLGPVVTKVSRCRKFRDA